MSLRAIKKRENQQLNSNAVAARPTLFKKCATASPQRKLLSAACNSNSRASNVTNLSLQQQRVLLNRATYSNPEIRNPSDTLEHFAAAHARLVRTKSESDVNTLLNNIASNSTARASLSNAKSEICLQTISSHNYDDKTSAVAKSQQEIQTENNTESQVSFQNMLSGARSHRDLTQSAYAAGSPAHRRLSECSLNSNAGYSQRTSVMSASAMTLSSSSFTDPNTVVRVPIIGYEVMEERARFTVYKLRVENPITNDCWLVMRRYTDFVRLNTKLKQSFPHISLLLPRKKIFGDNFNSVFLDNRVQGLQMFVNSIMAREELRKFKMVREFFCLDEPPSYSESMEECRAIFEAQEETIAHLKLQISSKDDLILRLQQRLHAEIDEKEALKRELNEISQKSTASANGGAVSLK